MTKTLRFIDHFGNLTLAEATALKRSGIDGIIVYLCAYVHPDWMKGVTPEALAMYREIGWKVCFNYEGDPTSTSYFTPDQGKRDAEDVLTEFRWLGIAPDPAIDIYYSVDYDAHLLTDFEAVDSYFVEVEREMGGKYISGSYGGLPILEYLSSGHAKSKLTKFWQTIAWSGGRLFCHANLYQNRVNTRIDGASVDVDEVLVSPGWWPVDPPAPPEEHWQFLTGWFPSEAKAAAAAKSVTLLHHWHTQVEKVK